MITAQIVKLSEMQKDTFGIFNWNSYINLRTGEVLEDKNLIYGLWESTRYIDFLKEYLPKNIMEQQVFRSYFVMRTYSIVKKSFNL